MAWDIEPLLLLTGDRSRLMQVTENLLPSAVKYTPRGGSVRTTVRHCGADVVLTVEDTGSASPSRTGRASSRSSSGPATPATWSSPGLGLVISKVIVEAHGGSIELRSEEGTGTCVRVVLPAGIHDLAVPSREPRRVTV
jgi:signal transduction histidine kinase